MAAISPASSSPSPQQDHGIIFDLDIVEQVMMMMMIIMMMMMIIMMMMMMMTMLSSGGNTGRRREGGRRGRGTRQETVVTDENIRLNTAL